MSPTGMKIMIGRAVAALTLAVALIATPSIVQPQQSMEPRRVAMLTPGASPRSAPQFQAFEERLRELGWIDGRTVSIEFRSPPQSDPARLDEVAAELVRAKVDVILVTGPEPTLRAATQATSTVPIVMVALNYDPVAKGYAAGLARPGGNVTGVFARSPEIGPKQLELLREALPKVNRIALLWEALAADQVQPVESGARTLGIQLQAIEVRPPYDLDVAFRNARGAGAMLVVGSPVLFARRTRIAELALLHKLPTGGGPSIAEAGGLLGYGYRLETLFRRAAEYVDRILKGTKPQDLPVEQPTAFELVVNLKTAKALGLALPQSILVRADRMIQ